MNERFTFKSGGAAIVGQLFLPPGYGRERTYAALIIDPPLSGLKDQAAAVYARKLAERGFICLAFDHRFFGESEGVPRQYESPTAKIEDIHNAATALLSRPDVDRERLGGAGIGAGGGYMAVAVATDKRFHAFASFGGNFRSPKMVRAWMGEERCREALRRSIDAERRYASTGEVEYMPVTSPGEELYDYYGTARGYSPYYSNRIAVMSGEGLLLYDPQGCSNGITVPSFFVHGTRDTLCPPEAARLFFDKMHTEKEFHWLDTENHLDLFDNDRCAGEAVVRTAEFFSRYFEGLTGGGVYETDERISTGAENAAYRTAVVRGLVRQGATSADGTRGTKNDTARGNGDRGSGDR